MIRFVTEVEGVVAFQRFHLMNSPWYRRQLLMGQLVVPMVLGLLSVPILAKLLTGGDPMAFGFVGVTMAGVAVFWFFSMGHLRVCPRAPGRLGESRRAAAVARAGRADCPGRASRPGDSRIQ